MKKLKPIIYLLIIASTIGLILHFTSKPAKADWYDDNWIYRASLTFTNSGSAVTNQYVTFVLATNSTYSALQSNCNDARFTDSNGVLLQYYQTNSCQAASTTYHVLMPNIPVGGNLVWFYLGNPNAPAGGNSTDFTQSSFSQGTVAQGSAVTGQGPYLRWSFNETTGTTVHDTGSQGNNGTITSATWKTPDNCIIDSCLYFDGLTSYVKAASSVIPVGKKSVSLWLRTGTTATQYVLDNSNGTDTNNGIAIDVNSTANKLRVRLNDSVGGTPKFSLVSKTTINDSQWHFIEVTWDQTTPILYVDGQQDAVAVASGGVENSPSNNLIVGAANATTPASFFSGFVDDVKVFNYARTAAQVKNDYSDRGGSKGSSAALGASDQNQSALSNGLEGYWNFESLSASVIQHNYTTPQSTTGHTTPLTVTFNNAQTAGDLNVIAIGWNSATGSITSVIDSKSNAYSVATALVQGNGMSQVIYYAKNIATATAGSNTVTITLSADEAFPDVRVAEFSGIDTSSPLDGSGHSATGSSASADSGSFSTTNANDLIYGAGITGNTLTNPGAGFTTIDVTSPNNDIHEYKQVTSTGSYNATATGGSGTWAMQVAAFKVIGSTDLSGNGNSALNNGSASFSGGKFGVAPTFDGSSKYFNLSNTLSGVQTVAFWVNPASTTDNFINLITGTAYINATSGTLAATGFSGAVIYVNGVASTTISASSWQHVVVTSASGINANAFNIGKANGSFAANNTQMDDIRVYNRALSPTEVQQLYNWAPAPVGYWKFDDQSTSSWLDSSGNGTNASACCTQFTSAVPGQYGHGIRDSVTSGGSVSMTANTVLDNLPSNAGLTVDMWIYPRNTSGDMLVDKSDDSANGWFFQAFESNLDLKFTSYYSSTNLVRQTNDILTLNAWNHVAVTWDGSATASHVHIYVNGVEATYQTTTNGSVTLKSDSGIALSILDGFGQTQKFNGTMDELKIYNYIRTQKQIVQDLNGGHPAPGSPVSSAALKFDFDEGSGIVAHNTGSVQENGAYNGGVGSGQWRVDGKFGSAINVNVSSEGVNIGDLDFVDGISAMSLSFWINPHSLATGALIMGKSQDTFSESFKVLTGDSSSSDIKVCIASATNSDACTGGSNHYATSSGLGLSNGKWDFITIVYDGTLSNASRIKFYKNAQPITSVITGTIPTSMTSGSTSCFSLGTNCSGSAQTILLSSYDEFKLFTSALTQSEIQLEYNRASSLVLGALSDTSGISGGTAASSSAQAQFCIPGDTSTCRAPIHYWSFNENSYDSSNRALVNDSGTRHIESNAVDSTGIFVPGHAGTALLTTSGNHDVTSSLGGLSGLTISYWFKRGCVSCGDSNVGNEDDQTSVFHLEPFTDGKIYMEMSDGTNYSGGTVASAPNDTNWHHLEMVFDGTLSGNANRLKAYIDGRRYTINFGDDAGTVPSTTHAGTLLRLDHGSGPELTDEIKFYDYARTAAQVAWDMNRGAPVGWWEFDECQGNQAHDSSGNNNTGTLITNRTVGTCQTSSTMWGDGANGKFNASLGFNGTGDQVTIQPSSVFEITNDISLSLWVKRGDSGNAANEDVLDKDGASNSDYDLFFDKASGGPCGADKLGFYSQGVSFLPCDKVAITDTTNWHHIVVTRTGSLVTFYHDGVTTATAVNGNAFGANNGTIYIGGNTNLFKGSIDDVRIYNYGLTTSQVQALFNDGAAQRFAPVTGTP